MQPKILVVDDEQDMVELLRFNLVTRGYQVIPANNGLDALHLARRHLPDLIMLDLMMEGIDGYTVCEILREQPSTKHIPIIVLTAAIGQITRCNCLAAGADDYLTKPFSAQDLLRRVEGVLASQRAIEEAQALAETQGTTLNQLRLR